MRGKEVGYLVEVRFVGITPAYAGKRARHQFLRRSRWDHPCICGEKDSPSDLLHLDVRITPAYAGKSRGPRKGSRCRQDHPRICGEKGCCKFSSLNHSGSPPRMRGKDSDETPKGDMVRITPAYAGKRTPCRNTSLRYWDHPRVCGEKRVLPRASPFL